MPAPGLVPVSRAANPLAADAFSTNFETRARVSLSDREIVPPPAARSSESPGRVCCRRKAAHGAGRQRPEGGRFVRPPEAVVDAVVGEAHVEHRMVAFGLAAAR